MEPDLKALSETLERIPSKLDALQKEVTAALEKQHSEVAATGKAQADLKVEVAAKMAEINSLKGEYEAIRVNVAELTKRQDEMEKKAGRPDIGGVAVDENPARIFLSSQALKEYRARGRGARGSDAVMLKSLFGRDGWIGPREAKANELLSSVATRFIAPQRADLVAPALRALRIRNLIPVTPTGSNAIEYLEELGFYKVGSAGSVTSITRSGSTATVTVAAHGIPIGKQFKVRIAGAVETEYNGDFDAVSATATTFTYTVSGTPTTPATGTITYLVLQTHGGASAQTEGAAKAQAAMEFVLRTANVGTIAHWIRASRQVVSDDAALESYINNRLLYGLAFKEDANLLYGSGVAPEINGILANTSVQNHAQGGDNKIDALRKAMTKVALSDYEATGIVINPLDWQDIELTKDSQNMYVFGPSLFVAGGGDRFFRIPVVVSNAIAPKTALVGNFQVGTGLWDREEASLRMAEQDGDNFTKNLVTILAEERLAQTVFRPEAFVEVTFT